jgi:hypothetical protein
VGQLEPGHKADDHTVPAVRTAPGIFPKRLDKWFGFVFFDSWWMDVVPLGESKRQRRRVALVVLQP